MQIYDGKRLALCFEVVSTAWKEIDALVLVINQTIEFHLNQENIRYDSMKRIWSNDEAGWIGTGVAQCFGLIYPPKIKPRNFLGFQISMLGDGMAIAGEPMAHFVYWNAPLDFNEEYVGFPLDDRETYKVESDRLIIWTDGDSPAWMFSIRLTSINTEGDVMRIVQAMMALLRHVPTDVPTDEALPSDLPGLVHYRMDDKVLKVIEQSECLEPVLA